MYLQQAQQVEKFLETSRVATNHGIAWNRTPDGKPVRTLYHGSAGVLLYYLELHRSTGNQTYLRKAVLAGDDLLAYVEHKAASNSFLTIGFYSGWPGYVFVLNELFKASREKKFRTAAILALECMTAQATEMGAGIGWIEPVPFSDITGITGEREVVDLSVGAAGAGIIYLYAHREKLTDEALPLAIKVADRLLEVAEHTDQGLRWFMMVDMPFAFTAPNFAHGGAGVGYFLADLYREQPDPRYLDAARSAADYIRSRTVEQSEGFLVCHLEEQQPPKTFYLGVCHGPAGTGRLMALLHQITGDETYWTWLEANFRGLTSTGAPEVRSPGLWQNFGQCCGDAGIGDYALFLYKQSGNKVYLNFARRIAEHLVKHSETGAGMAWSQAEHRNRPEFTEVQTGYMQGAAGIGSFLLHFNSISAGKPCKIALPETPFS
ncbi:MAG: lanthionine synthetase LanC family protein [Pseudomonadota bacterium]